MDLITDWWDAFWDWAEATRWSAPDWTATTTAASTAFTTLIVAVTAYVVYRQLKDARRTRHGELLTDLSRRWDEPLIVRSQVLYGRYTEEGIVKLVDKVYGTGGASEEELTDYFTLVALPNLIEALYVMANEGAISLEVIDQMWGAAIISAWADWGKPVSELRRLLTEAPDTYSNFENLALALGQLERKQR